MSDDELTIMRSIYPYATLESHMLVDGELYLRCRKCGIRPVPHDYFFIAWCNVCLQREVPA
jgi:hypothetical protein